MWLWLSLTALLCWSGSDLFSKIGCRDGSDRYSHLKMVIAVGVVMGLHAAFEIFVGGTAISWSVIWTYLPVPCCISVPWLWAIWACGISSCPFLPPSVIPPAHWWQC